MRSQSTILAAALVLAAVAVRAPASVPAPPPVPLGVPVNSGDKASGTIDAPSDRDQFRIAAQDGSRLTVTVKAKKSGLLPNIEMLDAAGNPVDLKLYLVGQGTATASIPVIGIHETGIYTLTVTSYSGTSGAYEMTAKVVADAKGRFPVAVPAGQTVLVPFSAVDGTLVDVTVSETGGSPLAGANLRDPDGTTLPGTDAVRSGKKLKAKKILLSGADGLYAVALTGSPEGSSTADVSFVARLPKVKPTKLLLGTEPRPAIISPATGRNGTAFSLTGTGFADGARVVFNGTDEATDVQWISATEIQGVAPQGEAAKLGKQVTVVVLNPDGQSGPCPSKFTFIGIPGPTSFSPSLSPLEGGLTVSLAGTRFRPGYAVQVGGVPATQVTWLSSSSMTFKTPANTDGVYDIVVFDEFARPAEALSGMWYSAPPAASMASPSALPSFGGVPITLTGTGLSPGTRVFVGGTEAVIQNSTPPTSIVFLCPPAKSGPVEVEVRDLLNRFSKSNLLVMTRALQDVSTQALPPAPSGADFWGQSVLLGDTTGDGKPEIVVASTARWTNPMNGQFMPASFALLNNGSGTFTDVTGTMLPAFNGPLDDGQATVAAMGDLDGNSRADALFVRSTPLLTGSSQTTFNGLVAFYDISYPTIVDPLTATATVVMKSNASGNLVDSSAASLPVKESTPAFGKGERWQGGGAALGDLDGDGDRDLLLVGSDRVDKGIVSSVSYTYKTVTYYYYYYYYSYTVKDRAILKQTATQRAAARVLKNNGTGVFTHTLSNDPVMLTSGVLLLDDFHGVAAAVGDLTGDGKAEAVIVDSVKSKASDGAGGFKDAPGLRVLVNNGTGTFTFNAAAVPAALGVAKPESEEWWQGNAVAIGDFDKDGDNDIAVGRAGVKVWFDAVTAAKSVLPALRIFRNNGTGTFTEATASILNPDLTVNATDKTMLGVSSMVAVDFDADGDTDLVVTGRVTTPNSQIPGAGRMSTRVLLNDGAAGMRDATGDLMVPYDYQPADGVAVGDIDGDGVRDVVLAFFGDLGSGRRSLRVLRSK